MPSKHEVKFPGGRDGSVNDGARDRVKGEPGGVISDVDNPLYSCSRRLALENDMDASEAFRIEYHFVVWMRRHTIW
jgi:hypothetical protein